MQPKQIKLSKGQSAGHLIAIYGLDPEKVYDCIPQDREPEDTSKVVYVDNPNYVKGCKVVPPYFALTKQEYLKVA